MSTNFHTPIIPGENNSAATWNTRYADLDSAIYTRFGQVDDRIDQLIIDDGTGNAEVIAARTAIPYLTGTPPALMEDTIGYLAGSVANVLAFGADATGVADSGAAIQDALDAYDIIYLPPGTYLLDTVVSVGSDKYIYGRGATLEDTATGGFALDGSRITIEGVRFLGTATDHVTAGVGGNGISLNCTANRSDLTIRNCKFEWLGTAIICNSPDPVDPTIRIENVLIDRCVFRDLTQHWISFRKSGAARGTNYHVYGLRVTNCVMEDIYWTSGAFVWTATGYIAGGVTIHNLIFANCHARNNHTTVLGCASGSSAGAIDRGVISNCTISGEQDTGTVIHNRMGVDLAGTSHLVIAGCTFEHFLQECIALFAAENFAISGCNMRHANIGVGIYREDSGYCSGAITGCTFSDMEDPSGVNTSRYGIAITSSSPTAVVHRVRVANCVFMAESVAAGTGIRIEDAVPRLAVANCHFEGIARGIVGSGDLAYKISVVNCGFYSLSVAAILMQYAAASTLTGNVFDGCVDDFIVSGGVSTTSYLRSIGNYHRGTTGDCYVIPNVADISIFQDNVFEDCADISSGTLQVGESNRSVWVNNHLVGSTPAEAHNIGRLQMVTSNYGRIANAAAAPTAGTWSRGDVVWSTTPAAGGTVGWVCVTAGTPGTWKTFGAIAA